jgi:hypothetical protein
MSAAKCEPGWGGEVQGEVSTPPHPAASGRRCASPGRVDPPPLGEGKREHTSAFSPRIAPELLEENRRPSKTRAQGMPGVRCTRGPV